MAEIDQPDTATHSTGQEQVPSPLETDGGANSAVTRSNQLLQVNPVFQSILGIAVLSLAAGILLDASSQHTVLPPAFSVVAVALLILGTLLIGATAGDRIV